MDKILNIIYVSCGLVASLITLFNLNTLKVELLKLFILNKEREDDELYWIYKFSNIVTINKIKFVTLFIKS